MSLFISFSMLAVTNLKIFRSMSRKHIDSHVSMKPVRIHFIWEILGSISHQVNTSKSKVMGTLRTELLVQR